MVEKTSPTPVIPSWIDVTPEGKKKRIEAQESAVEPWQYLVRRQHPWRMQLYVKGRNMTVRQLVGSMKANQLDEENAAADFHLPVGAIREALAYADQNKKLLDTEAEIERLMHKRREIRGPQPIS